MRVFYVYILKCSDNTYYTGITNNLERRLLEHNTGYNTTCYTNKRRPLELKWFEIYQDVNLAIKTEKKIKKWSHKKKEALIEQHYEKLVEYSKKQFNQTVLDTTSLRSVTRTDNA